jgi:membrane-associated phospholipid phosphatase
MPVKLKFFLLFFFLPVLSFYEINVPLAGSLSPFSTEIYGQQFKDEVKDFFTVGGDIFTAPAHFDKNDWVTLGITAAAATGAFFLDRDVKRFFARSRSSTADFIFSIDKDIVMGTAAASMLGIYGYGAIADDDKIRNLGLQLGEAVFYAGAVSVISKFITGRKRPGADCGCTSFNSFTTDIYNSSLPSAHTTLSFAFAAVMADYKDDTAWRVTWYTFAALVGMARIYHNMHWFSDTVLGAALGYSIGKFVSNHSTNTGKKEDIPPAALTTTGKLINLKIPL